MESAKQARNWAQAQAQRALKVDFIRFGVVGTVGFLITAIGLRILHGMFGLHITVATLISSELGLLSNFVFHEKWTYRHVDHSHKSLAVKFFHFHMSSWSGVVLITLLESLGVKLFKMNYLVSLVFAAAITMFWNFFWTKYYIFRGKTPAPLLHPEDAARKDQ
ncbi:MAG TPA: GtrA family protein [Candidatus Saccharimonadales bacterium]|nr:GtrA family protein [Candidatus Saccharimonadales bacterium]